MNGLEPQIPEIDLGLIARLDRNGPRYTSYPTADRFVESFTVADYVEATRSRLSGGERPLSLYVHLPFCTSLCYYCACNKIITRDSAKAQHYLDHLWREIAMQAPLFSGRTRVRQMHWGGGTPTYYSLDDLARLFAELSRSFSFDPEGEYSIEIDPRTIDAESMAALREMGFNRASFGVQDFDPEVQRAVNRIQSESETQALMESARRAGFESLNVDLIYGLPRQTLITFNRTLASVVALRPARIAVYNYAHLPSRFKSQRLIQETELPSAAIKLKLLGLAARRLIASGYVYIGMDHFALPEDPLAVAQREGRLHRNFQGYSTHAECDLLGLGVSAIGAIGPTYSQNARGLPEYYARLDRGELPIARGLTLTCDDLVRRAVIQRLMCDFRLSMPDIETLLDIDFDSYFAAELRELADFERSGLLRSAGRDIVVTPKGRMLIRSICMVFDAHLKRDRQGTRYSRTI
jgi:oxygen-independent coproporphyrinogen III oxidase